MKNNQDRGFGSWIKGIWGSFSRFVMRIFRPNRGMRPTAEIPFDKNRVRPLMGVDQFHNIGSLTVGNLMAKVQWRTKTPPPPSSNSTSVRDGIKWD
jgi:hypothetical protein